MRASVVFLTYTPSMDHPRVLYARECLETLLKNISFTDGELAWHIADDGSPQEHRDALVEICKEHGVVPTVSNSEHSGYGANYNLATNYTFDSQIVMPIEEDWALLSPLDISLMARALMTKDRVRCIRLGFLGVTGRLFGEVYRVADQNFLLFDEKSPELFIFAGGPRIETLEFEKAVGPWPEGLLPGETEVAVCHRTEARVGVAWSLDAGMNASQDFSNFFVHTGAVRTYDV